MTLKKVKVQFGRETGEIHVSDDALGREIEHAFRHNVVDERFDHIMSHAIDHMRRDEELRLADGDRALFESLQSTGFFRLDGLKRKTVPDEQNFNMLLRIRAALPEDERASFFTEKGLGGGLLSGVGGKHRLGVPLDDGAGRGLTPDYLRRIVSILPFIPAGDRKAFVSEDVPRILDGSKTYREFLENTMPYVEKHVRK